MTIKTATKVIFLICLVSITCVPIWGWALFGLDLQGVGIFVVACTGPMGVLTGAMAASSIAKRNGSGDGT